MPGEPGWTGNYAVGQRRGARQGKHMCTGTWLRSTGRARNSYHQESHGQCFLRSLGQRQLICGAENTKEDSVKISIRDVGNAKVVEVEGDVDLGTSPVFRRTLFDAMPRAAKLALNLAAIRYID